MTNVLNLYVLLILSIRLEELGYGVGQRVLELISCRDRVTRRETRLVNMLQVRC